MSQLPPRDVGTAEYYSPQVAAKTSEMAVTAMILSIVGVPLILAFGLGLLLSLVGVILGIIALVQINHRPGRLGGKGFAITGIVLGVVGPIGTVLLIAILLPSLGHSRVPSRSTCAANITGILKACVVYANENNDIFPTAGNPVTVNTYSVATGVTDPSATTLDKAVEAAHSTAGAKGNPVASLWLLALKNQVAPKSFICKSDPAAGVASGLQPVAGGTTYLLTPETDGQISYSIAYPWSSTNSVGGWWRNNTDSSLPLMSDMAPGDATKLCTDAGARPKDYNSLNHGGDGQFVGFADAHSEWVRKPDVGQGSEMIFCTGDAGGTQRIFNGGGLVPWTKAPVATPYDTVMVPARDKGTGGLK